VRVAAPFAGTLEQLQVKRGMSVASGTPLFALEQENEAAARREAQERLRNAQAQLDDLSKGKRQPELDTIRAQLAQAEASQKLSAATLARQQQLVEKNFVSKAALDEARSASERDRARIAELNAQLKTARLPARQDEIRAAQFTVQAAREALAQADWKLAQKSVRSSVEGLVTDTLYAQGEWVPAGSPVVSLLPPQNIKLRFFVPETLLGSISAGRAVSVRCDGCDAPISARIGYISPQAEYTPPVIYSRESRAKLVYMIEAWPGPADALRLHPGQPLEVRLQ
jgi:HlyD family secretion protein